MDEILSLSYVRQNCWLGDEFGIDQRVLENRWNIRIQLVSRSVFFFYIKCHCDCEKVSREQHRSVTFIFYGLWLSLANISSNIRVPEEGAVVKQTFIDWNAFQGFCLLCNPPHVSTQGLQIIDLLLFIVYCFTEPTPEKKVLQRN